MPTVGWCCSVLPAAATSVPEYPSGSHRSNHLRFSFSYYSAKSRCHRFSSSRSDHRPPSHFYYWSCIKSGWISCGAQSRRFVGRNTSLDIEERHARIRKQLQKPELSPSAYDTAWVAMVPSPGSPQAPCFPQCIQWILKNQQDNGTWGHNEIDSSANKETILATLACVIALKKWNVGSEHIIRGIQFIARNFLTVTDEQIVAPIGFDFIFSGMFSLAIQMGLQFPIRQTDIHGILCLREKELKRHAGEKSTAIEAYCAYVAEGFVNLLDWNDVMKFQAKNGSLFNSPSATAATLVANNDDKVLQYLNLLVSKFGSAVPTVFPQSIHYQLSMVDTLESVGISRHFSVEIKAVLDMIYSFWLQKDEQIMLDAETCAMAFRLLQMNGYDISSDWLSHVAEASSFHNSLQGYLCDTKTLLELYKSSKVILSERDLVLENIGCWTGNLLREKLCSDGVQRVPILEEVEYALTFPHYAIVDPLNHRRNIEHLDARGYYQTLKTKYLPCHVSQDILALAVEDFCFSQSIYQDEVKHIISWEKENRMDQLQFVRKRLTYCYLAAATTISPHELSDARIACAKSIMLTVVVDDFFDVGGSKEEQENLIELVEKWDEHHKVGFYSEKVKIVFYALYNTVSQLGSMASAVQKRDVTKHLAETWLKVMLCMLTEADWQRRQFVPTVEEYMTNAVISLALSVIILPAQYFLGETLSDCMVKDQEYNKLSELMFTCCRLFNDMRSVERESEDGKLNGVSLLALHSGGSMSIEVAKKETHKSLESYRRGLLELVRRQDSVVPRSCKELFWKLCKTIHLFYFQIDGFTSPKQMDGAVNEVINEKLKLQSSSTYLSLAVRSI